MPRSTAILFLALFTASAATAQDWTLLSPSTAPSPRSPNRGNLVDVPATGKLFMFGGSAGPFGGAQAQETWEFDGTTWTQLLPATQPPGRLGTSEASLELSSSAGRVMMYGGLNVATFQPITETWEWDGNDWKIAEAGLAPGVTSPNVYLQFAMARDAARDRVVLIGGNLGFAPVPETWEWDGASWTQRFPTNAPPPRNSPGMAYDAGRGVCVLYGGVDMAGQFNDTWEWDGTDWKQVMTQNPRMPAMVFPLMTYDATRQRIVLLDHLTGELLEYDGVDWRRPYTATAGPTAASMQIEYHSASQRVIAFGGQTGSPPATTYLNDTWAYGGTGAFFETYGTGCPGSLGMPDLTPTGSSPVPALGASFDFDLGPVAGSGIVVAIGAGASTTPVNLGVLGAPACWLYALSPAGMLTLPWPVVGNTASVSFRMPSNPVFAGGVIELQGVAPDASAPGQLITTHGGRGILR
ncbi:MAG: hypothetical protein AAF628_13630 [Planctomycetota bacterium]